MMSAQKDQPGRAVTAVLFHIEARWEVDPVLGRQFNDDEDVIRQPVPIEHREGLGCKAASIRRVHENDLEAARRPGEAGGIHAADVNATWSAECFDIDVCKRDMLIDQPDFAGTA